jgi:hypothetical protein
MEKLTAEEIERVRQDLRTQLNELIDCNALWHDKFSREILNYAEEQCGGLLYGFSKTIFSQKLIEEHRRLLLRDLIVTGMAGSELIAWVKEEPIQDLPQSDHAKREARTMIVDNLLQFADDHRPFIDQEGCLEREEVLAIDHVRDELVAWAGTTGKLTAEEIEKVRQDLRTQLNELINCDELWHNKLTRGILKLASDQANDYRDLIKDEDHPELVERNYVWHLRDLIATGMVHELMLAWARRLLKK